METLKNKLETLTEPIFVREGFDLVELVIKGSFSSRILQFFVDKDGGVTIDDCVYLSRKLSDLLEMEARDLLPGNYRLEVSSPGLDRPLKTKKDFMRNQGRTISLSFFSEGEKKYLEGTILKTNDEIVYLQVSKEMIGVPLSSIQKAKIKLKW